MIYNRSVPTNVIIPHVHYRDVLEAVTWLGKAFGFEEHFRYGDTSTVSGSQIHLGNAWLMIRRAASNEQTPGQLGFGRPRRLCTPSVVAYVPAATSSQLVVVVTATSLRVVVPSGAVTF